jgi:hypothetical protein
MNLSHFSNRIVSEVYSTPQPKEPNHKPKGFWVSVDDANMPWDTWCIDNQFQWENLECRHKVVLHPTANVLVISDNETLETFSRGYKNDRYSVHWRDVARTYQGIIITPYLWESRFDSRMMWYYGWDCASGCIWDAAAIQSISLEQRLELEAA